MNATRSNSPSVPQTLGKYRIDKVLGEGEMGIVYRGYDEAIERRVALKAVHAHLLRAEGGDEFLARFRREAIAAGRCLHPNIVTVFEYGQDRETPFIAFEYVDGIKLKRIIGPDLELDIVYRVITQILGAVAVAHQCGVIHRDIKPDNIFVCKNHQVKVSDFGIARLDSGAITRAGMMVGTPSYMSPEQITSDHVDARTDLYSTGVLLYELLTGSKPFRGQTDTDVLRSVLHHEPEDPRSINPHVPELLAAVVRRAISKNADQRFQSADEFAAAIARAQATKTASADAAISAPTAGAMRSGDTVRLSAGSTLSETQAAQPPPLFSPKLLNALEVGLLKHVGPISRILVERTAATCSSVEALLLELGYHIEDPGERQTFLAAVTDKSKSDESNRE